MVDEFDGKSYQGSARKAGDITVQGTLFPLTEAVQSSKEALPSQMNKTGHKAVVLYAILARDACDFIEMMREEEILVLETLLEMLTHPNEKHTRDTIELNALGASFVRRELENRRDPQYQVQP